MRFGNGPSAIDGAQAKRRLLLSPKLAFLVVSLALGQLGDGLNIFQGIYLVGKGWNEGSVGIALSLPGLEADTLVPPSSIKADVFEPADWPTLIGNGSIRSLLLKRGQIDRRLNQRSDRTYRIQRPVKALITRRTIAQHRHHLTGLAITDHQRTLYVIK